MKSLSIGSSLMLSAFAVGANEGLGISSWAGWWPGQISRADCPELRSVPFILQWSKLEPTPGRYEFDKLIGDRLHAAAEEDLFVMLMIWIRPGTPEWLFSTGVPRVYTDRQVNPLGRKMNKQDNLHPYYFHPQYRKRFFALIDAFGKYISALPPDLRGRIVFVQSAEGSTGDGQPYKGRPLEKQYAIPKDEWNAFRKETWIRYQQALPKEIPLLVNSDANRQDENDWLLDNMQTIALKHGMFSHGYHVSDNVERLRRFESIRAAAEERGIPVLTRGEMDGEMFVYAWSTRNVPQALYWSGLFATHCQLDLWNIPHRALKDEANLPGFAFFNRYAGLHDAASSPYAFCALRDGLDASDFDRFPVSGFGGQPRKKRDVKRYLKIAEAHTKYGARMDDPEKATRGGMMNRKRDGYNDVGWGILPGNYSRFLTQVDPGSGDVGLWHVDDTIYGRFARSFERESGKRKMCFRLDKGFEADLLEIRVTHLDKGKGAWSLGVSGNSWKKLVRNADSGEWQTVTAAIPRELLRDKELQLNHENGDDTVFHMVEIVKQNR